MLVILYVNILTLILTRKIKVINIPKDFVLREAFWFCVDIIRRRECSGVLRGWNMAIIWRSDAEPVRSRPLLPPRPLLLACINFISGGTRQAPVLWSSGGYKQQIGTIGGAMQIWWKSDHSREQLQQRHLHGMRRITDEERRKFVSIVLCIPTEFDV